MSSVNGFPARRAPIASLLVLLPSALAATPLTSKQTVFGHAIKNGPIGCPAVELTTFQHNCTTAPCVVTQIHVPSIYPQNSDPWDWQNGRLRVYVDGAAAASIDVSLLELAHVGHLGSQGNNPSTDGSPFGTALFGKTARTGGVYSTMRIPFNASIRTTIQAPPTCTKSAIYWFIIRGIEGLPVTLGGELVLPDQARLAMHRNVNVTTQPGDFIQVAGAPAGTAGALASVFFDAVSTDFAFLEACVRFWPRVDSGASPAPVFLSSGTEGAPRRWSATWPDPFCVKRRSPGRVAATSALAVCHRSATGSMALSHPSGDAFMALRTRSLSHRLLPERVLL
jgi:hypothetical protein